MNTAEICWVILGGIIVLFAVIFFLSNDSGIAAVYADSQHVILPFETFNQLFAYVN